VTIALERLFVLKAFFVICMTTDMLLCSLFSETEEIVYPAANSPIVAAVSLHTTTLTA